MILSLLLTSDIGDISATGRHGLMIGITWNKKGIFYVCRLIKTKELITTKGT